MFVNVHVRPRYACSKCKETVVQALLPEAVKPLPKSIVGANLLSQVIVSKFVDHIPLHRQERIFGRQGFAIPRKNLCDWVRLAEDSYLNRLYLALKEELFKESYLQGDETTLKVQDGAVKGSCHKGFLWGAHSPEKKIVLFQYDESRAGSVAEDIYKDFKGTLQADAYAGYNNIILPSEGVSRIACLAHVRRRFVDCEKACSQEASKVLSYISLMYRNESRWKDLAPIERLKERQEHSVPILLKLEEYLKELRVRILPRAPIMEAIQYALNQWEEIERIFTDGRFHLDNNAMERQIRPIAIGRKNYLFAGSHDGARRAAVIYSLLGTAQLHQVNPHQWLTYVFQNMRGSKVNSISELLPHRWKLRQSL